MKRVARRAVIKSIIGGGGGFAVGELWIETPDPLVVWRWR
jgi:hypothetical protein